MPESFNVAVIGSGPGGYAAAIRCAQRGASVAVIEKSFVGGTCLNCGCIPSKTLLASAHTLLLAKNAAMMGVDVSSVTANWAKMQARKDAVVSGFRKGLTGLISSHRIKVIAGRGIVTAPGRVKVEPVCSDAVRRYSQDAPSTGSGQALTGTLPTEIEAGKIILATGSVPIELPAIPFDRRTVVSSEDALSFEQIPQSLLIVGGGVLGCEMACVYAAVGSKVTIVEALSQLMPMEDQWVGRLLEREFKKLGITSLTGQKVTSIEKSAGQAKLALADGQTIDAEKVLVSIGRRSVVDEETVDALGLEMKDHKIAVDARLQTNVAGVYALGDAVGTTYLAHGAFAEAEVAAVNATGGEESFGDYSLVPRAVYTFPEIASVGRNEEKCQAQGLDVSVGKAFFRANGRSIAHNETVGEVRAVRDNATDKIVGVTMVGANVTELIGAARALIGSREKITEVSFPHPTVSEVLKEAVQDAFGMSLHKS